MEQTFYITEDLYASRGQRFVHLLIDEAIRYVFFLLLGMAIGFFSGISGNYTVLDWFEGMSPIMDFVISLVFSLVYYASMEMLFSRTVAKFITGTIVVDAHGNKPEAGSIIKRTFCRFIPFDALTFFGTPCRGWHDTIPDLYVVNKTSLEEARQHFRDFNEFGTADAEI